MYLYHMTFSANQNLFHYQETSNHALEASIKTPKEILFCKQTGLYILHTKLGLVVRGHLEPLCMFIVTSETKFMFFQTAPVVVYRLMTSVFSTSQHRSVFM